MDLMATDALGREWQLSTIQLDMNMPGRFGLEYTDEKGDKQTPLMIHSALVGSPERFFGILIEHFAGAFPAWLAPVQVTVLPIGEAHRTYAQRVHVEMTEAGIRAECDDSNDSLGKRISAVRHQKVPYWIVIGDTEIANKNVTLESRDEGKLGEMNPADAIEAIQSE